MTVRSLGITMSDQDCMREEENGAMDVDVSTLKMSVEQVRKFTRESIDKFGYGVDVDKGRLRQDGIRDRGRFPSS